MKTFLAASALTLGLGALPCSVALANPPGGALASLRWHDAIHADAGAPAAAASTAADGAMFVAGAVTSAAGDSDWAVSAYDASSGRILWRDQYDHAAGEDFASAVVASEGLVFVAGRVMNASRGNDAFIRAYSARTGVVVWHDHFDRAGRYDEYSLHVIAAEGGRVYAGGRSGSRSADWFVRAFDARTGAVQWTDLYDGGDFDHVVSLAAAEGRVYASGVTMDTARTRHFTVRAYDGRSGRLAWSDVNAAGSQGYFFIPDVAWGIAAEGRRVVAAGAITDASGLRLAVRSYDGATGAQLWRDLVNTGGSDVALGVTIAGGRAYVAGSGGPGCSAAYASDCDWLVRAYDLNGGALRWQTRIDTAHADDQASVIRVQGDRVVVTGPVGNDWGGLDWRVMALSARDGSALWSDLVATPDAISYPSDVALWGDRALVAGSISDFMGAGDWLVRTFELR